MLLQQGEMNKNSLSMTTDTCVVVVGLSKLIFIAWISMIFFFFSLDCLLNVALAAS